MPTDLKLLEEPECKWTGKGLLFYATKSKHHWKTEDLFSYTWIYIYMVWFGVISCCFKVFRQDDDWIRKISFPIRNSLCCLDESMPTASHDQIIIESDVRDTRHLDHTVKTTSKTNLSDGHKFRCKLSLFQCVCVCGISLVMSPASYWCWAVWAVCNMLSCRFHGPSIHTSGEQPQVLPSTRARTRNHPRNLNIKWCVALVIVQSLHGVSHGLDILVLG